jgi:signal transduction histidine kinase
VLLVTGWSLGLGLLITLLGFPVLLALAYAVRGAAVVERGLANALLGTRLAAPVRRPWSGSLPRALWGWAGDPVAWREQAYLLLRFVAGLPLAVAVVAVVGAGLQMLAAPTYYYAGDGIDLGAWTIDTLGEALLLVPAGILVLALSVPVIGGAAAVCAALARGVLGDAVPAAGAAQAPAADSRYRARRPGRRAMQALGVHAAAYLLLNVVLIVIWAATTPGEYFWPTWTLLPLGMILAIHAVIVLMPLILPESGPRTVALARHAGVAAVLALFLVGVWAVTTPGDYFWPAWAMLGLAIPVALHAARLALGIGARERMEERIDVLTTSRAGAVDAQAAELRRIERDLHDGAQARLVALAMDLGLAKDRVADDDARALVAGAHEEAKRALVELRDLARGIHPAVLTDRGLEAALGSLAGTSRIPVELDVDPGGRLDPPLEAAAYFVVAEALANAAKHSGATAVRVSVGREGGVLRVRVADDGVGGADPAGEGLTGLRRRIEAHDGRLRVDSPRGHGTTLTAELPCAS